VVLVKRFANNKSENLQEFSTNNKMSDTNKSASFTFTLFAFIFYKNINHFLSIKYDRVFKLKGTDLYREWRDMSELLLETLEL
jgi:hypothetical protein